MLPAGGVSVFPGEFCALGDTIAENHLPLLTSVGPINLLVYGLEEKTILYERARKSGKHFISCHYAVTQRIRLVPKCGLIWLLESPCLRFRGFKKKFFGSSLVRWGVWLEDFEDLVANRLLCLHRLLTSIALVVIDFKLKLECLNVPCL